MSLQFEDLKLIEPLLRGVRQEGYTTPTPIQQQAIPHVLEGRDLMGCAQTGTGKTAAFALPILQRLVGSNGDGNHKGTPYIRALVLAPTRELATQIGESFGAYGRHTGLRHATIYGGVGQNPQVAALRKGIDILVATPGRLLDLMGQGYVKLDRVEVFVLDEADRMLDMGFIHDVERVVKVVPHKRQTLMFSATMPPEIQKLARNILTDPVSVSVTPAATTVELTEQRVYSVEKGAKPALLQHLLSDPAVTRALVFTRTKHGANKVVRQLGQARITAEPIHSNKSQSAREKALANFKNGRTRVLVATDIAARGIDVDNITHVINFDLPNEPETYVHRIGRTGRAGATGIALSFCSTEEREFLRDIERLIRQRIDVVRDHPFVSGSGLAAPVSDFNPARSTRQHTDAPPPRQGNGGRRRRRGGSRSEAPRSNGDASRSNGGASAPRSEVSSRSDQPGSQQASSQQPAATSAKRWKGGASNSRWQSSGNDGSRWQGRGNDGSRQQGSGNGSAQQQGGGSGGSRRQNQQRPASPAGPQGRSHGSSRGQTPGSNGGSQNNVTPTPPRTGPVRRPRLTR